MEESEDNISSEEINISSSPSLVKMKAKKRSLVERELETSLTTRITSPITNGEAASTSRYGRARKLKSEADISGTEKFNLKLPSPKLEKSPNRHNIAYKMHASNSPIKSEGKDGLDNQIENIYNENISLSRFGSDEKKCISSAKKQPKIYIRKDLIQTKEKDDTVMLIKNMFSPTRGNKMSDAKSSDKKNIISNKTRNDVDLSSVVKTLDFGGNKKKKRDSAEKRMSQSDLFELEAQSEYQVGDLTWARMGTYPFWPCIVTRDPVSMMFIKKKLYGRLEKDIIHVTFLGDNGRRSWILGTMLREYLGLQEFETARDQFTSEAKRKDPRLYAAFFISEKRLPYWYTSVEEAEALVKEPKRLRIDALNAMLNNAKQKPVPPKSKKVARTNSDVSLSESLYDSLFSEDDCKNSDSESSKSRNKSFDVSDVVTACLDNMAAKTGITKIQKQSHMDRWLQKAKSNTPEKAQAKPQINSDKKSKMNNKFKHILGNERKRYSLRNCSNEADNDVNKLQFHHTEHDYSQNVYINGHNIIIDEIDLVDSGSNLSHESSELGSGIGIISKVETLAGQGTLCKNVSDNIVIEPETTTQCYDEESTEIEVITNDEDITIESYDINEFTKLNQEKKNCGNVSGTEINHDRNHDTLNTESCENVSKNQSDNQNLPSDKQNTIDTSTIIVSNVQYTSNNPCKDCEVPENITIEKSDSLNNDNTKGTNKSNEIICDESTSIINNGDVSIENEIVINSQHADISPKGPNFLEQHKITTTRVSSCIASELSLKTSNINQENKSSKLQEDNKSTPKINKINTRTSSDLLRVQKEMNEENITSINEENNGHTENITMDDIKQKTTQDDEKNSPTQPHGFELNNDNGSNISQKNTNDENVDKIKSDSILNNEVSRVELCSGKSESVCYLNTEALGENSETMIQKICTINGTDAGKNNLNDDGTQEIVNPNNISHDNDSSDRSGNSQDADTEEVESVNNCINKTNTSFVEMNGIKGLNFLKYVEQKQDAVIDEHPELTSEEITNYLYKTWQYEESLKTDRKKLDDIEQSHLVKGVNNVSPSVKKGRKRTLHLKSLKKKQTLINFEAVTPVYNKVEKIEEANSIKENTVSNDNEKQDRAFNKENEIISQSNDMPDDDGATCVPGSEDASSKEVTDEDITEANNERFVGNQLKMKTNDNKNQDRLSNDENEAVSKRKDFNVTPDIKEVSSNAICAEVSSKQVLDGNFIQKNDENIDTDINCDIKSEINRTESASDCEIIESASREENHKKQGLAKDDNMDVLSINSESSESSVSKRKLRTKEKPPETRAYLENTEFLKYFELRQDALMDEHPELTQEEITVYLYNTWLYEENLKTDRKKTDDIDQANLVKGLNQEPAPVKRVRKKKEKEYLTGVEEVSPKDKSKRRTERQFYREDFSDVEDEIELFEIFKREPKDNSKVDECKESSTSLKYEVNNTLDKHKEENMAIADVNEEVEQFDQVEEYFRLLTEPKPNLFKGLIREKVCEICEKVGNLVKCKGCCGMFHVDCTKKVVEVIESPQPNRGRKKKRKNRGRKPKGLDDSNDDHSDDKSHDPNNSEETLHDYEMETHTIANAEEFETKLSAKLKEMLESTQYDTNSSDEELNWSDTDVGKCKVVDIILRKKKTEVTNYTDFKCKNCEEYTTPVCFVCRSAKSPKQQVEHRQKCQVAHCNQYYHLECLEHWPQTQFNSGEPSRMNKKINEHFEPLSCPRHVCHTCVCDDPRGCKTRFCGDKLAKCVRCPATYHTFTKCLPAGTQILTGSHIICPRHYEHRPGKVPCHVNTGWCFICALGGSLICCEYCPTSFHAECLNIKPPEGGYMCEDCETGCLPLYGEMVWVKLGHYRWWPGLILHPSEIPENILAVKHYSGEFVVRFFGQYDHYWVNRGRVFPFQEGDTGRISSKNSKIDAAFAMAVDHAQRAFGIIKNASPSNEGDENIASSLMPPHYVKLKVNRPLGSLAGRRTDEEGSYTQCECDPAEREPCGPYSHCLNRMLLTECGPTCRAGDRCHNRAFEKRQYPRMEPYRTASRGWGLRALEDVRAGQFVIEYVGELIDEEEFRRRMRRKHEVRDENYYFLTLDKERMIDAGPKGNLARFMNHSCEPNCETQKWTVLGDVRVGLFALYDIPANSELTFNYNLECAGIEKKRCMCGTKRCSGFMGAKPKQDESQSKKKVAAKRANKKRKPVELSPTTSQGKTKRGKPKVRELTEIEKDLLIINGATNGLSSDSESSGRLNSIDSVNSLKRKRLNYEEACNGLTSPTTKRTKLDHKNCEVDSSVSKDSAFQISKC